MATNLVDPFNQSIVLSLADGVNMTTTMDDLTTFTFENIRLGLVYGCAIGLSALMLISLLLLTQPGKRRSPIYVLNVIALVLDIIRSSLMAAWLDSMWNHPVTYFEGDYSRIGTADIAKSVAADVVKLLELGTILVSLTFQVRVIMSTAPAVQRALVLSIAFVVVMVIICVKLAVTVVNARNIANFVPVDQYSLQYKLSDASEILQLVGVGIFLIIFMTKLGIAIRQRYRLGQSKFGPMQMVFIGSLQSMAIPTVCFALQWNSKIDLSSLAMTMLAIQLPLTALWASTSLEDRVKVGPKLRAPQHPIAMGSNKRPNGSGGSGEEFEKKLSTAMSSNAPLSPMKARTEFASSYMLDNIPATTTIRSLDVDVKMDERDMV